METPVEIARHRLFNQHIGRAEFGKASEVVAWLGAVQAKDYLGALWALGLRTRDATEEEVEKSIAAKSIVRTWPMRGTLHFVAAADVRWMLNLLAPRIVAASARRRQQLGLDEAIIARSKALFVGALQGGKQLTRAEMYGLLEAARISTAGGRGLHILWQLAHEGIICFGARKGKQQTFALLDDWVPAGEMMERDEALAELATRYFTSHGPATLQDFAWWSGLATADARAGLEMAKTLLAQETVGGQAYWIGSSTPTASDPSLGVHLLPAFDEYTVAYKDRSAVLDPSDARWSNYREGILSPTIVVDGQVVGTWKRTSIRGSVVITLNPFASPKKAAKNALAEAAHRYGHFLGLPVVLA